jgi:hypothetical protein
MTGNMGRMVAVGELNGGWAVSDEPVKLKDHISFWCGKHEWSLSMITLGICEQSGSRLLPCSVHYEIEN